MDKKLQKYYDDRFDMMLSQGWKDLEKVLMTFTFKKVK